MSEVSLTAVPVRTSGNESLPIASVISSTSKPFATEQTNHLRIRGNEAHNWYKLFVLTGSLLLIILIVVGLSVLLSLLED